MSKSLVQMVNELFTRVAALEQRPTISPELIAAVARQFVDNAALASKPMDAEKVQQNVKQISRAMCPKCGVKPNHFFHVKTCKGQQKEQKNGENAVRRRDQGTT